MTQLSGRCLRLPVPASHEEAASLDRYAPDGALALAPEVCRQAKARVVKAGIAETSQNIASLGPFALLQCPSLDQGREPMANLIQKLGAALRIASADQADFQQHLTRQPNTAPVVLALRRGGRTETGDNIQRTFSLSLIVDKDTDGKQDRVAPLGPIGYQGADPL